MILLAADRPLPLLEPAFRRVRCTGRFTVETDGFSVRPHEYYRGAVDELGLELKPFQYELDLEATQEDVNALRAYLAGLEDALDCYEAQAVATKEATDCDSSDAQIPSKQEAR